MLAKELISDIVPALRTTDAAMKALNWMEIFRISHLPIVQNDDLLGLISDADIFDMNMADEPIGSHNLSLFSPFVYSHQHIYEIIELVSRQKLTVVPVVDKNKKYLGVITLQDIVQYFSKLAAVENPGAIIVLEMNLHDYSLTQISNIVEGNDIKILSCYIQSSANTTQIEVTLKLNSVNIGPVLQTFERYEYNVKASFLEDENLKEMLNDRYEEFMTYLNV